MPARDRHEGQRMSSETDRALEEIGAAVRSVADTTCPAVGPGDLLVLSCGPGRISMVEALAGVARRDGARLLYLTAQPQVPPADRADRTVHITAQTMADDR